MRPADIIVRDAGVDQRRVHVRVAQEALNLFKRHPVMKGHGGDGVAEDVRRDPHGERPAGAADDGADRVLDSFRIQRAVGRPADPGEDERRRI